MTSTMKYGLYGTNATKTIANKKLTLTSDAGTDAKVKLNDIGNSVIDFEVEYDTVIRSASGTGFIYRTSYWADANNTYGYSVDVSTTFVRIACGGNSSTPAWESLIAPAVTFTVGSTVHIKVIVRGDTHKVLVNNVQYINYTDARPGKISTGGGMGFRSFNGVSIFSAFRFRGMWPTPTSSINDLISANGVNNDFTANTGWTLVGAAGTTVDTANSKLILVSDGITAATATCTLSVGCSNITVAGDSASTTYVEHLRPAICAKYGANGSSGDVTVSITNATGADWHSTPAQYTISNTIIPQSSNFKEFITIPYAGFDPSQATDGSDLSTHDAPTSIKLTISTKSTKPFEIEWISLVPVENNRFKYKVTLNSDTGQTTTPKMESILFVNKTTSDTGIIEGDIEEFNNPIAANDSITMDFGRKSREDGITDIQKVIGMDFWIDDYGRMNACGQIVDGVLVGGRGNASNPRVFTVGQDIGVLGVELSRDPMANKLTLVGSGQIANGISLEGTSNQKDENSIAIYGIVEKTVLEKGLNDMDVINLRCLQLLRQLSVPQQTVTATIIDKKVTDFAIGDTVKVSDPTGTTGIMDLPLRITKIGRAYGMDGEGVSLEFANVNNDIKAGFDSLMGRTDDLATKEQRGLEPQQVSYVDNCDNTRPSEMLVYIDESRKDKVQDILFFCYSRAFRATNKGGAGESDHTHTIPHTHNFTIQWGDHGHDISHTHTIDTMNHDHKVSYAHTHQPSSKNRIGVDTSSEPGHHHHYDDIWVEYGAIDGLDWNISNFPYNVYTTSSQASTRSSAGGGAGSGGNTSTGPSNTASSASGSQHTHTPDFGIYEYDKYAPCKMYINVAGPPYNFDAAVPFAPFGIQGSETTTFQITKMSLLGAYAADNSKSMKPGVNFIYIRPMTTAGNPKGLLRIYIDVRVIYK